MSFNMNNKLFIDFLNELKDSKLIKVTGSFADKTNNINSDIDFYVKQDSPDTLYSDRNILKIINILNKYNIKFDSSVTGYIYTHKMYGNCLPIEIEFSDLFYHRKNRLKEVEIFGVKFKTH